MVDDGLLGNSLQSSACAVVVSVGRLGVAGVAVDVEDGLAFIGADDVDEAVLKGSDVPYVTNILNLTVVNFCKFLSADYISHRQNNDKVIKVLL